jgi:tryptophanyl-tRNA synthetase
MPATIAELETRPEAANLLGIYAALADKSLEATVAEFAGSPFSRFKETLSELAVSVLGRIGGEMRRLMSEPEYIDRILRRSTERARAIAEPNLREVCDITGLLRP